MRFFENTAYCLSFIFLFACFDIGESNDYDILMLGNSYTYFNGGINKQLKFLFDSANDVSGQVEALVGGGLKLSQHALRWEGSVLDTKLYDYVILQDQSQVPSFPFTNGEFIASRDGAIVLDEKVEAAGAETIFFLTWGYRLGDQRNPWVSPDYLSMQANLERGYKEYAESITDEEASRTPYIAPVGLAFKKIYDDIIIEGGNPTNQGTLFSSLYTGDNSHPSSLATYLAACVMFSTITGRSTINMSDDGLKIDESTRLKLQQAADFVVFDNTLGYTYPWESTNVPGPLPTEFPTDSPSTLPSESPSAPPSRALSASPSESPSASPSESPSTPPSRSPSASPSGFPSVTPSEASFGSPSGVPSMFMEFPPSKTPVASMTEASGTTSRRTTTKLRSTINKVLLVGIPLLIGLF